MQPSPNHSEQLFTKMDQWYQHVPGKFLVRAEQKELGKLLADCHGQHLLQIGGPGDYFLVGKSAIRHRVRASPYRCSGFHGPSVQTQIDELPFLPNSVHAVILAHTIEFSKNPQQMLHEVYTILAPEGRLILLSFNPFSLWGLAKLFNKQENPLCSGHFWSLTHLKHWLKQTGFLITEEKTLFFRPQSSKESVLENLFFLEAAGRVFWSNAGAVNLVVAIKKTIALTPIKQAEYVPSFTVEG